MLTIGSRGSQLALWQARWIRARLESFGLECRLEIIHTTGDKITDVALSKVGTKGLFTKEIEEALLAGSIDVAVHSLKDMPTELPAGLTLAAIPEREDPRDALIGGRLAGLAQRAHVGTSSLRRAAQLRAMRPDLEIENIRGNLDTRLRKLDEGNYDAIVLASAGLRRLGWDSRITECLEPDVMCPAVGQGALAVETRDDGGEAQQICGKLEHAETRIAVTAERAVLASLGGGCQVPIGAHATVDGATFRLRAIVVSPDGAQVIRKESSGRLAEAATIGRALGDQLLAAGGAQILEAVYGAEADSKLRT
jgi:hydroxymethylbilane synthase